MMRSGRVALFLILGAASCVGCSGIRVTTDFDPSANFAAFRSYAWLPDTPQQPGDPRLHNALVDGRVRSAVERALAARGFQKVPTENADFLVTYHLGLETRMDVQTIHRSHGYSSRTWHRRHSTQTIVTEYEMGTLLLDVLDPTRGLVWRGSANARVRERSDPAQRESRINDAVQKILDRFPPT